MVLSGCNGRKAIRILANQLKEFAGATILRSAKAIVLTVQLNSQTKFEKQTHVDFVAKRTSMASERL